MPMKINKNQSLESLIAAIQELLYELKNEQDDILTKLDSPFILSYFSFSTILI